MRSQVDYETDDEYFDDPIKLFDLEHDRVHFGSRTPQYGITSDNVLSQSLNNEKEPRDAVHVESSDDDLKHLNAIEYKHVSVKLVDCTKYPWYFRKYTKQLIKISDIYDLVSDSDNEVDVENICEGEQYLISNNIISNYGEVNFAENSLKVSHKITTEKRLENYRHKQDFELQFALSRKNLDIIDFKRNKGLIGMTITQKKSHDRPMKASVYQIAQDKDIGTKHNEIIRNISYKRDRDKFTRSCGTKITPISANIEKNNAIVSRIQENLVENVNNEAKELNKFCVQFSLGKMSDRLLDRIITKTPVSDKQQDRDPNKTTKEISVQKLHQCKSNVSANVENVEESNKYKKLQPKETEITEKEFHKQQQNLNNMENTNIHFDEESSKSNSPILPCSTLKKNREFGNISLKGDKSNTISMNMTSNTFKEEMKQKTNGDSTGSSMKNYNSCNDTININNSQHVQQTLQMDSQPNYIIRQLLNENKELRNEKEVINTKGALCEKSEYCDVTYINKPSSRNDTSKAVCNVAAISHSAPVTNLPSSSNIANCNNFSDSIKLLNQMVERTAQSNVVIPIRSQASSVISYPNRKKQFIKDYKATVSMRNVTTNNEMHKNDDTYSMNNDNIPAQNNSAPYPSPVALKHNQSNAQSIRFKQANLNGEKSVKMSTPVQSRYYPDSYSANYQMAPYSGLHQRFNPTVPNISDPNFRFPPPYENVYQPQYNEVSLPPFGWQQFDGYPNTVTRGAPCWKNKSCFPGPGSQSPQSSKVGTVSQAHNTIPPKTVQKAVNIPQSQPQPKPLSPSATSRNKGSSVNKNYFGSTHKQKKEQLITSNCKMPKANNDGLDVITCKDRMAEELENAVKSLKRMIDYEEIEAKQVSVKEVKKLRLSKNQLLDDEKKQQSVINGKTTKGKRDSAKEIKRPKLSLSQPTMNENEQHRQTEQQKGYSPPILPIPTYENIMGHVINVLQKQDGLFKNKLSSNSNRLDSSFKKVPSYKSHSSANREDAKKISLEEYKQRALKREIKIDNSYKKVCRYKTDGSRSQIDKSRGNVDRFSTESDLGYDSDSTVVL